MAGRGTDIMLGGNSEYLAREEMKRLKYTDEQIEDAMAFNETDNKEILTAREKFRTLVKKYDDEIKEEKEKVIASGGLKIIGTERHESRRIDNQLRGRSGRQGDIGESKFYIGLDDDLMKIFGGDMITNVYNTLGADEDMPIESKIISGAVEKAQKRVEGKNFSIRKHVLQYDDVMNTQREIIYAQRKQVLDGHNLKESIMNMIIELAQTLVDSYSVEEIVNKDSLKEEIRTIFGLENMESLQDKKFDDKRLLEELTKKALARYEEKEQEIGESDLRELERVVMLKVVDQKWMDHIDAMDELKDGIGLRAYGQKDPVVQYRIEGTDMFDQMVYDIHYDVVKILLNIQKQTEIRRAETARITNASLENINSVNGNAEQTHVTIKNEEPKIGRNDSCPCGSGKKYKNCCGK